MIPVYAKDWQVQTICTLRRHFFQTAGLDLRSSLPNKASNQWLDTYVRENVITHMLGAPVPLVFFTPGLAQPPRCSQGWVVAETLKPTTTL